MIICLKAYLAIGFSIAMMPLTLQAQVAPSSTDTAISELATRIGKPLKNSHVKRVIVADLTGPQGQVHAVGKWLADKLSGSLAAGFPKLKVLSRPQPQPFSKGPGTVASAATNLANEQSAARDWARSLGADVVVTGIFGSIPQGGMSVSLKALHTSNSELLIAEEWGVVPLSETISALSEEPLPVMARGVPAAGRNGFGVPECVYCPAPSYTDEARGQKLVGVVVLQVTITADGTPTDIYVWKSLGGGLDAQAVKVLQTWRFKPANGPDGKPAATTTPIEVMFHLY
jgi:TonB family protein